MIGMVRPSSQRDVWGLTREGLRDADMVELSAAGLDAKEAIQHGFDFSLPFALTVDVDGIPAAMFGVADDPRFPDVRAGLVWFLGTDRITEIKTQFLRESRRWLDLVTKDYQVVGNLVHEHNTLHIKWLQWLGFTLLAKHGPFIEFARINHVLNETDHGGEPESASGEDSRAADVADPDRHSLFLCGSPGPA